MKRNVFALGLMFMASAHAAGPTAEDVGDPDSFGRSVIYLGLAQTQGVSLQDDCSAATPEERCIVLNAQPAATSFDEKDLATMTLPARASKSLLCFALTPLASFQFHNLTGVSQPNARYNVRAVITIENEVLNDPALIDPATGLPFGGRMTLPLSTYSESRSIGAGEREQKNLFLSRHCIGGLVNQRNLVGMGLSAAQATEFFGKPMKLTFGAQGSVQIVDFASHFYGIRLYGDR